MNEQRTGSKSCPLCGQENNPAFRQCWKCGRAFPSDTFIPMKKQKSLSPKQFITALSNVCILGGIGILFLQSFHWLKAGHWREVTVLDCLHGFSQTVAGARVYEHFSQWLYSPGHWKGLSSIVKGLFDMPGSLCLIGFGLLFAFIARRDVEPLRRDKGT